MNEKVIKLHLAALADPDNTDVTKVYNALDQFGSTAVPYLIKALSSSNATLRLRVALALTTIKDNRVIKPLLALLDDENLAVQALASVALGKQGLEAVPKIVKKLENPKPHIRKNGLIALGIIQSESVIEPIANALQDEDADIRSYAAYLLGEIGDDTVFYALNLVAQNDKEDWVRDEAASHLTKLNVRMKKQVRK